MIYAGPEPRCGRVPVLVCPVSVEAPPADQVDGSICGRVDGARGRPYLLVLSEEISPPGRGLRTSVGVLTSTGPSPYVLSFFSEKKRGLERIKRTLCTGKADRKKRENYLYDHTLPKE